MFARRYATSPVKFQIRNVALLKNFGEGFIKGLKLRMDIRQMTPTFRGLLKEKLAEESNHKGFLQIDLYDPEINRSVSISSDKKAPISIKLLEMLDEQKIAYEVESTKI